MHESHEDIRSESIIGGEMVLHEASALQEPNPLKRFNTGPSTSHGNKLSESEEDEFEYHFPKQ